MTNEEKRLVKRLQAVVKRSRREHATSDRMKLALAIVDIVRAKKVRWFESEDPDARYCIEADIATVKGRRLHLTKRAGDMGLDVSLGDHPIDVTYEGEKAINAAINDVAETKRQEFAEADARCLREWLSEDD